MAAINGWPSCSGWTWTPSRAAGSELLSGQVLRERVRRVGAGGRGSKKNARHPEPTAAVAARGHGRGSDGTAGALDRLAPGANQQPIEGVGPLGLSQHRAASAGGVGLRAARQSQESLRSAKPGARPSVPLPPLPAPAVRPRRACPIISVDTKKKELVGPFKNNGRLWSREALPVNDHDFPSLAKGMAIPRGLYDLQANRGSVLIGTSHDTPEFAVDAIVEWWRGEGRRRYPQAPRSCSSWPIAAAATAPAVALWKCALQEKLADRFQLAVTVCHYPTGASKWNPIEHRLFSEISKHWAGQPLTDYPTIVRLIGETKTKTGLRVKCALSTKTTPPKSKSPMAKWPRWTFSNTRSCPCGTTPSFRE